MSTLNLTDRVKAARKVGVPFIAISTPDLPALEALLVTAIGPEHPAVTWDAVRGYRPANEAGTRAIAALELQPAEQAKTKNPVVALELAAKFPGAAQKQGRTVVFAHNLGRFLSDVVPAQALANLRDKFKADGRTVVVLGNSVDLPAELRGDFVVMEDPLPTDEQYGEVIKGLHNDNGKAIEKKTLTGATDAVRGLSTFGAEQVVAMSMASGKLDLDEAWERKRTTVNTTKGLTMVLDGPPLENLRGLDALVQQLEDYCKGPNAPHAFLFIDEIDKALKGVGAAGGAGDSSGVSDDFHQVMLTNMNDNDWDGFIFYGVRGSGKTELARSIGAKYGIPLIKMDPGAMKGGIVGSSEKAHREAMRIVKNIGGSRVCVLATCNKLDAIPAELMRRFTFDVWYFDLPTDEEKAAIWPVYLKAFGHDLKAKLPNDQYWTGSDIRKCCKNAQSLGRSVAAYGAQGIVPVAKGDPQGLANMRALADGRFLSVQRGGAYVKAEAELAAARGKRFVE